MPARGQPSAGFEEILDGKLDDVPEQAFYLKGGIEEVREHAERMKKEAA